MADGTLSSTTYILEGQTSGGVKIKETTLKWYPEIHRWQYTTTGGESVFFKPDIHAQRLLSRVFGVNQFTDGSGTIAQDDDA